jgi:hypothetical protein
MCVGIFNMISVFISIFLFAFYDNQVDIKCSDIVNSIHCESDEIKQQNLSCVWNGQCEDKNLSKNDSRTAIIIIIIVVIVCIMGVIILVIIIIIYLRKKGLYYD